MRTHLAETTGRFDFDLSLLAVLLGSPRLGMQKDFGRSNIVSRTFIVMNVVPIATTIATTTWVMRSDNCPLDPQRECKPLSMILDSIGLVTARLARLDLGVCLLLATRGQSGWLFRATGGLLGFTESVPAHRAAGWCYADPVCPPLDRIFMFHASTKQGYTLYCAIAS